MADHNHPGPLCSHLNIERWYESSVATLISEILWFGKWKETLWCKVAENRVHSKRHGFMSCISCISPRYKEERSLSQGDGWAEEEKVKKRKKKEKKIHSR